MGDVAPLNKTADRVDLKKTVEQAPGLAVRRRDAQQVSQKNCDALSSEEYIVMVKPRDVLSFKRDGVQHGIFKNLRLGKYVLDSRLDLHGLTVVQAQQQVFQFLTNFQLGTVLEQLLRTECSLLVTYNLPVIHLI